MKMVYQYNKTRMELHEIQNEEDIEFNLTLFDQNLKEKLKLVKDYFDQNTIVTDLLVFTHLDKHFQIIVRKDFYQDFLLQMFKYQLFQEIKWM